MSRPQGADYSLKCAKGLTPLQAAIDELRWKRQCSSRYSNKAVLKRISSTVRLLKEAENGATLERSACGVVLSQPSSALAHNSRSAIKFRAPSQKSASSVGDVPLAA